MKFSYYLALSAIFFQVFANSPLLAQKVIRGVIKDANTRQPIRDAMIEASPVMQRIASDERGRFELALPANEPCQLLIVTHLSYLTDSILCADIEDTIIVLLKASTKLLPSVALSSEGAIDVLTKARKQAASLIEEAPHRLSLHSKRQMTIYQHDLITRHDHQEQFYQLSMTSDYPQSAQLNYNQVRQSELSVIWPKKNTQGSYAAAQLKNEKIPSFNHRNLRFCYGLDAEHSIFNIDKKKDDITMTKLDLLDRSFYKIIISKNRDSTLHQKIFYIDQNDYTLFRYIFKVYYSTQNHVILKSGEQNYLFNDSIYYLDNDRFRQLEIKYNSDSSTMDSFLVDSQVHCIEVTADESTPPYAKSQKVDYGSIYDSSFWINHADSDFILPLPDFEKIKNTDFSKLLNQSFENSKLKKYTYQIIITQRFSYSSKHQYVSALVSFQNTVNSPINIIFSIQTTEKSYQLSKKNFYLFDHKKKKINSYDNQEFGSYPLSRCQLYLFEPYSNPLIFYPLIASAYKYCQLKKLADTTIHHLKVSRYLLTNTSGKNIPFDSLILSFSQEDGSLIHYQHWKDQFMTDKAIVLISESEVKVSIDQSQYSDYKLKEMKMMVFVRKLLKNNFYNDFYRDKKNKI